MPCLSSRLVRHYKQKKHQRHVSSLQMPISNADDVYDTYSHSNGGVVNGDSFINDHVSHNTTDFHYLSISSIRLALNEAFKTDSPSYSFYDNDILYNAGLPSLISKSLLENASCWDHVDPQDISLHFALLQLIASISHNQRDLLVTVLQNIVLMNQQGRAVISSDNTNSPRYIPINLPLNTNHIRTKYIRGTNSLCSQRCIETTQSRNNGRVCLYR